jgi:AraC-like DNA-binding protein
MIYRKIDPDPRLADLIKNYWVIEDPDARPERQKIIPDGFCELIFHYGDPYRINLGNGWNTQTRALFAGQIRKHFFLENTGSSGMVGVKLYPTAPHLLFNLDMSQYTDRVVDALSIIPLPAPARAEWIQPGLTAENRVDGIQQWLLEIIPDDPPEQKSEQAVQLILASHGLKDMATIAGEVHISQRQLQRQFSRTVGLSPKFFARIIRFAYIFELLKQDDRSWIDVALDSGHFDQAHFIKNFKEFTGEEPTRYGFSEENMANFFLKKR